MVSKEKQLGPVLVLDAGNALWKFSPLAGNAPGELDQAQARFLLEAMGKVGVSAMALGERDLVLGVDALKEASRKSGVTLLAANLAAADGKRPFAERRIFDVGGTKVGVFGLTGGPAFERVGLKVLLPSEQAQKQADLLRKEGARLVIALMTLDYDQALKVTEGVKGVDFVIQSHDGRVSSSQRVGDALLVPGGERGRMLGRAEFDLSGTGRPIFDRSEAVSARQELGFVEQNVVQLKERIKNEPSKAAENRQQLELLVKRRQELLQRMEAKPPAGKASVMTEWINLDGRVGQDDGMRKLVDDFKAGKRP